MTLIAADRCRNGCNGRNVSSDKISQWGSSGVRWGTHLCQLSRVRLSPVDQYTHLPLRYDLKQNSLALKSGLCSVSSLYLTSTLFAQSASLAGLCFLLSDVISAGTCTEPTTLDCEQLREC